MLADGAGVGVDADFSHSPVSAGPVCTDVVLRAQFCDALGGEPDDLGSVDDVDVAVYRHRHRHRHRARPYVTSVACPVESIGGTVLKDEDEYVAAQRHLFNRLLGQLDHYLQVGQTFNEAKVLAPLLGSAA
jgi:hypothetical protein